MAGETGSGKTTQLPKICLELGRGVAGQIGHTQPRRIAARTRRRADRRGARHAARRRGRLQGAVHRQVRRRHRRQADDRRHPAGRDRHRPEPAPLRHPHHRRGPRAQPEHRLHPRLPAAAAAAPPRPQGDHHLRDHRPGAVRRALRGPPHRRARPDRRGVRPHLPGRGPLPPDQRRRSATSDEDRDQVTAITDAIGELEREGPGDILVFLSGEREIRDTADALKGRREHRRAAAVLPAVVRRAAPGLRGAREPRHGQPPRRARHQRRRDLAHRPRHPLRDRPGHRPDQPLQPAHQGAAAADRGDLAGQRQPAQGPLRPRRRRHLHPAVLPGGLRVPPRVHRPGDPAHQPGQRHPADGRRPARRRPQVPVRRPAGPARDHRRRQAARGAERRRRRPPHRDRPPDGPPPGRPPHRPDDHRVGQAGLRPRDPRHRRRAVHPGPARAPHGQPAGRRHRAPPLRPAGIGLPRLRRAVGLPRREAARAVRLRVPPPVPRRVPQLPARPRVAGPARPAVLAHPRPRHQHQDLILRTSAGSHRPARRAACRRSA